MTNTYYIGIDAGGTSTRARLARGSHILSEGHAGSANPRQVGVSNAHTQLERAIAQAFEKVGLEPVLSGCKVFAGIAGIATDADRDAFLEYPHPYAQLEVTSDALLTLDAYFSGSRGALLIVGTGCIALARAQDRTIRRRMGWGFPLEQSGGADLGLQAVRLGLSDWEAERRGLFRERFEGDFPNPRALIDAARGWSAGDYARFAPVLLEAARLGDARALQAVQEWVARGYALLEELKIETGVTEVGVWGGLSEAFLEFAALEGCVLEGYGSARQTPLDEALKRASSL